MEMCGAAWATTQTELSRVSPREGVLVPLIALEMKSGKDNPCRLTTLHDIARVTMARVLTVPSDLQCNQAARVHLLQSADHVVNQQILSLTRRYPLLRACGYIHSHPFAVGTTSPSVGHRCDYQGHMLPMLQHNRACGLNTSFSFIACRAFPQNTAGRERWKLLAFALDHQKEIVELGEVATLSGDAAILRRARLPHLYRRTPQKYLLRRFRRALKKLGSHVCCDGLYGGWVRLVVQRRGTPPVVVLVPLTFPQQDMRFFQLGEYPAGSVVARARSRSLSVTDWLGTVEQLMPRE